MLTFWDKIVAYLQNKANLRKVIITGAAVFLLLGVVLFSSQIQKLLNLPWGIRAEGPPAPPNSELNWQDLPSLSVSRSNAKLIDVVEPGSNRRWLYAIGGIRTVDAADNPNRPTWNLATKTIELIEEVERLELGLDTGLPLGSPPQWETAPAMNTGHAEFGLVEYDGYIYVIAGDIHMPAVGSGDPEHDMEFPLLYATIERLPLNNLSGVWETVAYVSGVNFYPEVQILSNQLHIVGGIFGNPFRTNAFNMWGGYSGQDPIDIEDDFNNWDPDIPVIGGPPIVIPSAGGDEPSIGGLGTESVGSPIMIQDYSGGDPADPWDFDWLHPWLEDNPWANLSAFWSELLLNGEFYTTVSEHYAVTADAAHNLVEVSIGELGVDYQSEAPLYKPILDQDFWNDTTTLELLYRRVFQVGHLRIFLTSFTREMTGPEDLREWPMIMPAPQGRYGHRLIVHDDDSDVDSNEELLVVGGASWSNPLVWLMYIGSPSQYSRYVYNTYWVVDDARHPMQLFNADIGLSDYDYFYVGNITYNWGGAGDNWWGTNASAASWTNQGLSNTSTFKLSDNYALKADDGTKKGLAFFGLAKKDYSGGENMFEENGYIITGGLENVNGIYTGISTGGPGANFWYVQIQPTKRVLKLQPPLNFEWKAMIPAEEQSWWDENGYNLSAVGIDKYRSIAFNGQNDFRLPFNPAGIGDFQDIHVPDYTRDLNSKTRMFDGLNWFVMPANEEVSNFKPSAHAAVHDVRILQSDGEINVVVYRVGGSNKNNDDWLPIEISQAQYLGPFTYGLPGVPDPEKSSFKVVPEEVVADGLQSATATLVLLDYYGAPVVGTKAVVATDANSSWPPVSTDNIKIRPLVTDPPQVVPLGWPTPWLVTDANGTVQFKLTSVKEIPQELVRAFISTGTSPPASKNDCDYFPIDPQPISFTLDGAVSDLNSTVEADPIKVIADGIDFSTVTVTLLDHQDPPQPVTGGYYVKILSSRNIRDINQPPPYSDTDKIKIINQKTDSDGKATFEVRSSVRGEAMIYARYSLTVAGLDDSDSYISLTDTAAITFGALIKSLVPDHGLQGQLLDNITATGAATHWSSTPPNTTTVELIPPSKLSFYWVNNDPGQDTQWEDNIDDLYLNADGRSIVKLGIWSQANPRTAVTFNILDNADGTKGSFWPGGEKDQISGITDSLGRATFFYQSGSIAGIVKIRATIGGISDEAWLILHDARPNPYLLRIIADPTILDDTTRDSVIKAALYRYVDNQAPVLITTSLTFHFVSDSNGTFSEETVTSEDGIGIASTTYTRSTTNGRVRIFAWVEEYESEELFLANKVVIYQKGGTAQISFMPPIVTDNFKLRIDAVNIGETADLGFWTFRAITPMGGEDAEIVDYPFQVLPYDWNVTAKLTAIDPKVGIRGTNNLQVAITGQNTHFYKGTTGSSVVTFKPSPLNPGSAEGIEVLNSTLDVDSDTSLKITINIAHDAVVGFWNVQVATGSEIATLAGNTDFLVTDDPRGYFINLWAAPDHLARDGSSTSKIDAYVGKVDPLTGRISCIDGVTVNFAKNDNGILLPASAVTSSCKATTTYTTDAGETNEIVTITAYASPETGVMIAQWTDIYKEVYVLNYLLTAEPTELPLRGTAVSNLSITGLPGNRIPITLYFNGSPKGHLEPVSTTSNTEGKATSQYIAAPESERIQEVVRIYAIATIPGFGQVRSNIVDIQVGRADSECTLELSAAPNSVIAGGTLRSTVTAVLKCRTQAEPNWPIEFTLDAAGTGDYLTDASVRTNSSGVATTCFVPGNVVGAVIVKAFPQVIPLFRQVIITKTTDGYPDEDLSTISAVPSRCLLPDGVAFSVVTITLRNSNYVPVVGRQVRLSTDHSGDTIKLADGTTATSTNTNSQGKAIFHISSTMVGTSNVTAKFDADFDLITDIIFEALGVCIPQKLDLTVPFELRDYDNLVLVYVTENGLTNGDFVNEVYTKSARPLNKIDELKNIMLYLHPNKTYTVWVKGRYHLAKTKPFTTGSIGNDPIPLIFDELLIADIEPDWSDIYNVSTPFQDNAVNAVDFGPLVLNWFKDSYLADFTLDGQVNSLDFSYWRKNYGRGALGGPPPLYDQ